MKIYIYVKNDEHGTIPAVAHRITANRVYYTLEDGGKVFFASRKNVQSQNDWMVENGVAKAASFSPFGASSMNNPPQFIGLDSVVYTHTGFSYHADRPATQADYENIPVRTIQF